MLGSQTNPTECELCCTPAPESETVTVALASLLTVTVPLAFPAAVGVKVLFSTALCPGPITVFGAIPLTVNPVPATVTPAMVTFAFPVFASVAPSALLVPSITSPKLSVVGFAPSNRVAATMLPAAGIEIGEFGASLAIEIIPFTLPLPAAVNVILKALLCPPATTNGSVNPVVPNPLPVTVTLDIVALAFPLFVIVMVCELTDPAATFGKLALFGVTESCACCDV